MGSSSINLENLSPKSKMMMNQLGGGLESMRLDIQSVNAKVSSLSRGKEKERHKSKRESEYSHEEGYGSYHSKSSRSQRSERVRRHERYRDEPKRNLIDLIKGTRSVEEYFKEMKVTLIRAQVVESQEDTMCLRKGHIASQCPNKRTIFLRENGEIEIESSREETSTSSSESGYSCEETPYEGYFLMRKLEESKEIQKQVIQLLDKELVRESCSVGSQGVKVDEEKVKAIQSWPTPKPVGDLYLEDEYFKEAYELCVDAIGQTGIGSRSLKPRPSQEPSRPRRLCMADFRKRSHPSRSRNPLGPDEDRLQADILFPFFLVPLSLLSLHQFLESWNHCDTSRSWEVITNINALTQLFNLQRATVVEGLVASPYLSFEGGKSEQ
ncbi:hypothetical protein CR513_21640, partial [Mucuna pruriens]